MEYLVALHARMVLKLPSELMVAGPTGAMAHHRPVALRARNVVINVPSKRYTRTRLSRSCRTAGACSNVERAG